MEKVEEKFDAMKFLLSPLRGMYWVKTVSFMLGISTLLFVGYAIYKAYVKKPDASQLIQAADGSNITVIQNNQRKRFFIPFIEVYGQAQSGEAFGAGARAGARMEF